MPAFHTSKGVKFMFKAVFFTANVLFYLLNNIQNIEDYQGYMTGPQLPGLWKCLGFFSLFKVVLQKYEVLLSVYCLCSSVKVKQTKISFLDICFGFYSILRYLAGRIY